ncbi:MAG: hypothetical protein EOS58_13855 [Mesorhizobium sp.]|uniref:hypothetical protein n=1 Tax=Mesorhizobium sp. TaxID=1871066 RepID=UPI000FE55B35|nr:hypothetical protein [Mesorhizobium sp.]RWD04743.1 MAG: hypothetical protein EOS58_13855 [Mesorhizobium sp.]RWD30213.1 MAG: hypothetical protein EOS22_07310 [Mesorhizobium sp.]RWD36006.1 MAG: hypothetical protein EOS33_06225 [Mesorhizobium sp.]TIT72208.1 MAG: hypothetical protein E5W60_05840 [Mesorhizobium sp.]
MATVTAFEFRGAMGERPIEKWPVTYDAEVWAKKYGLTLKQAKTIISSNGPPKHGCDVGAAAFIRVW